MLIPTSAVSIHRVISASEYSKAWNQHAQGGSISYSTTISPIIWFIRSEPQENSLACVTLSGSQFPRSSLPYNSTFLLRDMSSISSNSTSQKAQKFQPWTLQPSISVRLTFSPESISRSGYHSRSDQDTKSDGGNDKSNDSRMVETLLTMNAQTELDMCILQAPLGKRSHHSSFIVQHTTNPDGTLRFL
ncbi:hypothetical protein BJY00DRAFT_171861 [Aspergillus carlsbadensis]|nr:hypothetical protein BJY00DRAFT_171861 [Aspergillus carlsbadensis]